MVGCDMVECGVVRTAAQQRTVQFISKIMTDKIPNLQFLLHRVNTPADNMIFPLLSQTT